MSDVPQIGYRVVQITHQEPIPRGAKADFSWAIALLALLFCIVFRPQPSSVSGKPNRQPAAASHLP